MGFLTKTLLKQGLENILERKFHLKVSLQIKNTYVTYIVMAGDGLSSRTEVTVLFSRPSWGRNERRAQRTSTQEATVTGVLLCLIESGSKIIT